jgi:hypothetical protein
MSFFTDSLARWREGFAVICPQCGIRRHFEDVPKDCYYCDSCGYSQDTQRTCLDQDGKNLIDEGQAECLDLFNYCYRIMRDKLGMVWLVFIPVDAMALAAFYFLEAIAGIVGRGKFDINKQNNGGDNGN